MAHFAKLDNQNIVVEVVVINNDALEQNNEEASGIELLRSLFGAEFNWKQTSYNSINGIYYIDNEPSNKPAFRKTFAGVGYSYNETLDMFIIPKCHDEAVLNELGDWDCDNLEHEAVI